MDANERRKKIYESIVSSGTPLKGGDLARVFGVSRQVIVQDVALLRAQGKEIIATPEGYVLPVSEENRAVRLAMCSHYGFEAMRSELYTVVDMGGVVEDIQVPHAVYGEIIAPLLLHSRRQVDAFVDHEGWGESAPLSALTEGIHLHKISAVDEQTLDAVFEALRGKGFLVQG